MHRWWVGPVAGAAALLVAGAPALAAPYLPLSAAQVQALGGHLEPWQVHWLETGGASGVPGTSEAATATTAVTVWDAAGFVATATASGSCWTGSIAAPRAGAYRCSAGNAIHDPCFVVPGAEQVACPVGDPDLKQGVLLQLTAALPSSGANTAAASAAHPWRFTLAGGGACGAMTGTLVSPDHPYGCLIPATATTPQASVYCTAPAAAGDGSYVAECAPLSAERAANGAPQLDADTAYAVAQMWL